MSQYNAVIVNLTSAKKCLEIALRETPDHFRDSPIRDPLENSILIALVAVEDSLKTAKFRKEVEGWR